jgi:ribosomal protein L29
MAVIRKSELKKMSPEERARKVAELEKAMLELCGEGRRDKARPLRKAIAKLKTPPHGGVKAQQPLNSPKPKQ